MALNPREWCVRISSSHRERSEGSTERTTSVSKRCRARERGERRHQSLGKSQPFFQDWRSHSLIGGRLADFDTVVGVHRLLRPGRTLPGHGHCAPAGVVYGDVCGVAWARLPEFGHADRPHLRGSWSQQEHPHGRDVFSLAGVIGSYLVHALVLWRTLHFSFEILHTGRYWAMKVPGIEAGRPGKPCHGDGRAERPPFPAHCFFRASGGPCLQAAAKKEVRRERSA